MKNTILKLIAIVFAIFNLAYIHPVLAQSPIDLGALSRESIVNNHRENDTEFLSSALTADSLKSNYTLYSNCGEEDYDCEIDEILNSLLRLINELNAHAGINDEYICYEEFSTQPGETKDCDECSAVGFTITSLHRSVLTLQRQIQSTREQLIRTEQQRTRFAEGFDEISRGAISRMLEPRRSQCLFQLNELTRFMSQRTALLRPAVRRLEPVENLTTLAMFLLQAAYRHLCDELDDAKIKLIVAKDFLDKAASHLRDAHDELSRYADSSQRETLLHEAFADLCLR